MGPVFMHHTAQRVDHRLQRSLLRVAPGSQARELTDRKAVDSSAAFRRFYTEPAGEDTTPPSSSERFRKRSCVVLGNVRLALASNTETLAAELSEIGLCEALHIHGSLPRQLPGVRATDSDRTAIEDSSCGILRTNAHTASMVSFRHSSLPTFEERREHFTKLQIEDLMILQVTSGEIILVTQVLVAHSGASVLTLSVVRQSAGARQHPYLTATVRFTYTQLWCKLWLSTAANCGIR